MSQYCVRVFVFFWGGGHQRRDVSGFADTKLDLIQDEVGTLGHCEKHCIDGKMCDAQEGFVCAVGP